jgi:hypothetical protein
VKIRQVPVALADVEAVTDEELVGHGEAHIANGQILDEPAVRPVEEGDNSQRGGAAQGERLAEVVQREAGVDHVLDDQDVAAGELLVEVLEQADPRVAAGVGVGPVARELDEVERMGDGDRAREIRDEDDAGLERGDEQRLATLVVLCDLAAELAYARRELLAREVDLPDRRRQGYDASSRRYRCARRSMSRL